ncbi:MAG: hypothetical protein ACRYFU_19935 [Janthinobacterium lividum]
MQTVWVAEFANWYGENNGAQIDTLAKHGTQMTSMVDDLGGRGDVPAIPGSLAASAPIRTSTACWEAPVY